MQKYRKSQNSRTLPKGLLGFLTALGFAVCVVWACSAIVASGNAQSMGEDFRNVARSRNRTWESDGKVMGFPAGT